MMIDVPPATALSARKTGPERFLALDAARGIALVAMIIFHLTWDLEFFGFLERGVTQQTQWRYFARIIAASFLFLAGFSLVLAHHRRPRMTSFWKRFAKLVIAALLISLVTYLVIPQAPVSFGVLHAIAASSLVGLLLLRTPVAILISLSAVIFTLPDFYRADMFNWPGLWWVGLSSIPPKSFDYVPLMPWFSAFLLGMAAAQNRFVRQLVSSASQNTQNIHKPYRHLSWMGQNSLLIYLLHQPILMGLIWLMAYIMQ